MFMALFPESRGERKSGGDTASPTSWSYKQRRSAPSTLCHVRICPKMRPQQKVTNPFQLVSLVLPAILFEFSPLPVVQDA